MRITIRCCCLLLTTYCLLSFAQAPDTAWTKTYGGAGNDGGNSIKQTSDGGYIIAGYTESFGAGQKDVWLLKTDVNGDTLWTKTYGGVDNDWAEDVQLTTDGGYIIAANTESYGSGEGDIWLIKTNSQGDTIWTRLHGGNQNEVCHAVQQTADGGYIIAGWWQYLVVPSHLVLKTDINGDTSWINYIWSNPRIGECTSVFQTMDSGYLIAGYHEPGQSIRIPLLVKMDANGDTLWCRTYGPYAADDAGFSSVKQTADNGYITCGSANQHLIIIKTNSSGDTLWTKEYGDPGNGLYLYGSSMQLTNHNECIFTGGSGVPWDPEDLIFLKTNEYGDALWCVFYGDSNYPDCGCEVLQSNDSGYVIIGCTASYDAGDDIWLLKFESDMNIGGESKDKFSKKQINIKTTIFKGRLILPNDKSCKVFDITGREVKPHLLAPGIYFIEVDGVVTQKVIRVR